jgi:hypothetical protein
MANESTPSPLVLTPHVADRHILTQFVDRGWESPTEADD